MEIIHAALDSNVPPKLPTIRLPVDRRTLAKRRWRGVAVDAREFGFDLEKPLADGDIFFADESDAYLIAQKYEPVLEMRIADGGMRNGSDVARVGDQDSGRGKRSLPPGHRRSAPRTLRRARARDAFAPEVI